MLCTRRAVYLVASHPALTGRAFGKRDYERRLRTKPASR